jgi:hypothetical protein
MMSLPIVRTCAVFSVSLSALALSAIGEIVRPTDAEVRPAAAALPHSDDPVTAEAIAILAETYQLTRQSNFIALLDRVPAGKLGAVRKAFALYDTQGLPVFAYEWDLFWVQWGMVAPLDAIGGVAEFGENPYAIELRQKVLRGWASRAPKEAWEWLAKSKHRREKHLSRSVVDGWARNNLATATEFAAREFQNDPSEMALALQVLRDAALRQGMLGGMHEWFDHLPEPKGEGDIKAMAVEHLWWTLDKIECESAAAFLSRTHRQAFLRNDKFIENTARAFAEKGEFIKGIDWAASLEKSPITQRMTGVDIIARRWPEKDAEGFRAWLPKNREHPAIDSVILGFVRYLIRMKDQSAERWANEIKSEKMRTEAVEEFRDAKLRW